MRYCRNSLLQVRVHYSVLSAPTKVKVLIMMQKVPLFQQVFKCLKCRQILQAHSELVDLQSIYTGVYKVKVRSGFVITMKIYIVTFASGVKVQYFSNIIEN